MSVSHICHKHFPRRWRVRLHAELGLVTTLDCCVLCTSNCRASVIPDKNRSIISMLMQWPSWCTLLVDKNYFGNIAILCVGCPVVLCQNFRILFLRSFPVRNVIRTCARFSTVTELRTEIKYNLNDTARLQMYFQGDGEPHISVNTWRSTWISSSLAGGWVVVVRRIGHRGHRTSFR
jgi:hypothetical protein